MVRRLLIAAAILASAALGSAIAQQQPTIKRTPVQIVDFPPGFNVVTAIAEITPGNCAGRHTHPGVESSYVLEGALVVKIAGQPDVTYKAGDSFQIPPGVPHDACTVPGQVFKILGNYIVEKGKPLASPAP